MSAYHEVWPAGRNETRKIPEKLDDEMREKILSAKSEIQAAYLEKLYQDAGLSLEADKDIEKKNEIAFQQLTQTGGFAEILGTHFEDQMVPNQELRDLLFDYLLADDTAQRQLLPEVIAAVETEVQQTTTH